MTLPGYKTLDRYIIKKFLGTYLFAIALISIVIMVFDAVEKIDDFIELKAPLKAILFEYYLNFIPFMVNQFSGLFTFIAVIFFTSKLAYQSEIIAILSNGISFRRLMWPYFLSAAAIALLSLSLNLWVIPVANTHTMEFKSKYLKKNRNVKYERHIYRQIEPGLFVYVRNYSGNTERASYLMMEKYDGSTIVASLEAGDVAFNPETKHWTAPKYLERNFTDETETFTRYEKLDTLINLDAMELGKVEELVTTMRAGELNQFIAQQKAKGSDMISIFEVERQNRYAYPAATFILTLIGVALSSRKVRGGMGLHIGVGIGLCFTYILIMRFAEEFAKGGVLPPAVSLWLPNVIYAIIGLYLYRKAPK